MSGHPNDTPMFGACCGDGVPAPLVRFDADLQGHVCPDCRTQLMFARAKLAEPCDGGGRRIAIKGCTMDPSIPDNL